MLAKRAQDCKDSLILSLSAKAAALRREGFDVIDFGAGQPDFEPPEHVKQAIIQALNKKGYAKYTPTSGIPELKSAIVEKFREDNKNIGSTAMPA